MALLQTSSDWWDAWLDQHGRDSEEEKAFLGYLSTHNIGSTASPDRLEAAYAAFKAWMDASAATPSAGPSSAPLSPSMPAEPQSHRADPAVEKPMDDVTSQRAQPETPSMPSPPAPQVESATPAPEAHAPRTPRHARS